jgi:hypothetical protein
MRSLVSFENSIHIGATGIALVIVGALLLGLLTIPMQTKARATTPPYYSGYYAYALPGIPATGGGDIAGVGADAPLAHPGNRSVSLPIVGASALLVLGAGSVGASFWLTRPSRRQG